MATSPTAAAFVTLEPEIAAKKAQHSTAPAAIPPAMCRTNPLIRPNNSSLMPAFIRIRLISTNSGMASSTKLSAAEYSTSGTISSDCPVITRPSAPATPSANATGNPRTRSTHRTATMTLKLVIGRLSFVAFQQRPQARQRHGREQSHSDRDQQLRYPDRHRQQRQRTAPEFHRLLHHLQSAPRRDQRIAGNRD